MNVPFDLPKNMSEQKIQEYERASDPLNALRKIKQLIYNARKLSANAAVGQFPKYN